MIINEFPKYNLIKLILIIHVQHVDLKIDILSKLIFYQNWYFIKIDILSKLTFYQNCRISN